MKKPNVRELTVQQLIDRYVEIGLAQDSALMASQYARVNRLVDLMREAEQELKSREGDQRRALVGLYHHPNIQVRLNAVRATLAVEPQSARQELQAIADSRLYPQAGDAGMSLLNLDKGIYKPT